MKKISSILMTSALVLSASAFTVSTAYAEKKCKDGYVWDVDSKKCVKEKRGSY